MSGSRFSDTAPLPADQEAWLDALCDRFEAAWKAGGRPRLQDYLAEAPGSAQAAAAWDLLCVEAHHRRRLGEEPLPADYEARLPMLAAGDVARALAARPPSMEVPTRLDLGGGPRSPHGPPPRAQGYVIEGVLGHGGMSVVYRARDARLGRPVALKFLRPEICQDARALERFRREARTASSLNHPNIGTVYALDEHEGQPYLVLELVEGQTLRSLAGRPVPLPRLIPLVRQAARALAVAHAAGVVHRDVKPENLMVRPDGLVKVLDFGLARLSPAAAADSARLTGPGALVGTLRYMAPEQAWAEPAGAAADVFALGIVLYELAAGRHPFDAGAELDVLAAVVSQAPAPPSRLNPEISAPLESLILHMLAKDPAGRPGAAEVEARLARLDAEAPAQPAARPAAAARRPLVGRRQEWDALRAAFEEAAGGRGSMLCVTGEPGLGKTTLVEGFLAGLADGGRPWALAHGRCSERLAGAEAYLPFLEALDGLLRADGGESAALLLKRLAPTWYVQLAPPAAGDPDLARLYAEAREASQERRKRELGHFLDEASRQRPLVLFLDDVHWADPSSVDLLAYLGARCTDWRVLLVLTYRPSDLLRSEHPFGPVALDLQAHGACREVALPFLGRDELDHYLALAFAGHRFPEELPALLHARTEGHPLFLVDLLRYLRDRGVIVQEGGHWALARAVPDLRRELPESVRSMIRRKVDQLGTADCRLLMAAAVQGPEFDSAVAARVLGEAAADVEERLAALERAHALVRRIRENTLPDGTPTVRYGFVHVLYQNTLYEALQPTRKAEWSAAAARALLGHYGEKSAGIAAELAILFEAARDRERAADHYLTAAQNAARVFAHHEAVALLRRGLAVLQTLPETPERARRELPLQVMLGLQSQVVRGYASPEAESAYARARALCEEAPEDPPLFPLLRGLWAFYEVRCDLQQSQELADRLLTLALKVRDAMQLLQAHQALAITRFSLGDAAATHDHMGQGLALYDAGRHHGHRHVYSEDPGMALLAFGSAALWQLGYPDRAVQRSRQAVALGEKLGQPTTLALVLHFAAMLRQYRREAPAARADADAVTALATEHGFSFWLAGASVMRGWTLAEQGKWAAGVAELRQGMQAWAATGGGTHRTYHLALLAEALGRGGQVEEALAALAEAEALMVRTGEGMHGPELHRLRGEFLLRRDPPGDARREAEDCFRLALDLARQRQARSLELRGAVSLARLLLAQGRRDEARVPLAECYAWFTEGFDTADLRDARALLDQLA